MGPALLLILDLLTPTERIAFVLHDIFDLSFDEIARHNLNLPLAEQKMLLILSKEKRPQLSLRWSMEQRVRPGHQAENSLLRSTSLLLTEKFRPSKSLWIKTN